MDMEEVDHSLASPNNHSPLPFNFETLHKLLQKFLILRRDTIQTAVESFTT